MNKDLTEATIEELKRSYEQNKLLSESYLDELDIRMYAGYYLTQMICSQLLSNFHKPGSLKKDTLNWIDNKGWDLKEFNNEISKWQQQSNAPLDSKISKEIKTWKDKYNKRYNKWPTSQSVADYISFTLCKKYDYFSIPNAVYAAC